MSDASLSTDPTLHASGALSPARNAEPTAWFGSISAAWRRLETGLVRLSDRFNPILVTEARQALRGWQFPLTFILLLVACWVVTIGGVALVGPSIYFAAGGGEMLRAYYVILSLSLLVVVPFAAFYSLASEHDGNTYEVLSITTLRPRQIISGKLASAVVQMIMYLSAITPCLAFTYLLRGIDAPTIALLLAYTFFASLGFSMVGLLLATLARQRYNQLILSVGFVSLLLLAFSAAQDIAAWMVRTGHALVGSSDFWILHLAGVNLYVTTFALAFFAAVGMITFATENRSTPLRILMLVQQASFVGWMAYFWITSNFALGDLISTAVIAGGYWFVMGTMLNGERDEMSCRVRRRLPQSTLGRMTLTWLKPGPSSGYMFAVANFSSIVILCAVAEAASRPRNPGSGGFSSFLILGWSYVVIYLGLGRLVVATLRSFTVVTLFASALLHILLLLAGSGIPTSIQWMSPELQNLPYSYLQITNPFWTLAYLDEAWPVPEEHVLLIVIPAAALCVLLLNLPGLVRELRQMRTALPVRVARDEAELHPLPAALPQNPWDAND